LYLPENANSESPLVMLLHGNGGSFDQTAGLNNTKSPESAWLQTAEENNFLVAVPNGSPGASGRLGWNDCRNDAQGQTGADHVKFIDELMQKVQSNYGFDQNRVYVSGISNGGFMANRLAMEMPEKISAFASVISSMPENSECENSTLSVSALFMNGTADPVVPYEGGEVINNRGAIFSTQKAVNYWTDRNETDAEAVEAQLPDLNTGDNSNVMKFSYLNGTNNTAVVLYKINNGGHTAPSIDQQYNSIYLNLVGNQNHDIEMAEEIWAFFEGKTN